MPHLFAYGTLMCEDIMQAAAGCSPAAVRGVLRGYSRRRVKGEDYPGLLPIEGGRVEGMVYCDVPDSAWKRLDRFEGNMYVRRTVYIELADGGRSAAETYVVRLEHIGRLDASEWDVAEFLRHGKARFQSTYKGFRAIANR
jgi:gamma-glutamylcyclotransferase (GGCT)/AIG2-like uncharacterized protein YtfP